MKVTSPPHAHMANADLRFYEELNNFLALERRKRSFDYPFERKASIKDVIESMGVPHTEVDLILVNGDPVNFSYILLDGDRVSIYPAFEAMDISQVSRLRPKPLRITRFIVDVNLGRLARYLRLLGFDSNYSNDYSDRELVDISVEQERILLTRDRNLLKHARITHGCFVHATRPLEQVKEVLNRLDLYHSVQPFHRCTRCNGLLEKRMKSEVEQRLPPLTRKYYDHFWQCCDCQQVYWRGAHYEKMVALVERLLTLK
ncbi:MAG: Mut7-C RNAse domain-containing protein [Candidatus Sedimenticola sp. (ex Thyasira tokunagai)]